MIEILLTLFIVVWSIDLLRNLYLFYVDYFIKGVKRKNVFLYMFQTIFILCVGVLFYHSSDVKRHDQERYGKETLNHSEKLLGIEWEKGTVVTPANKDLRVEKVSYIKPSKPILFQGISVEELKVESYIPSLNMIDNIEVKLDEESKISNFPCSKHSKVKILAYGMLLSCRLSEAIEIKGIKIDEGTTVKLLNPEGAVHPTFKMMNEKKSYENKNHIPIWKLGQFRLQTDTNISGIECLKGAGVAVVDNGKLLECSHAKGTILDGLTVKDGCRVTTVNALQSKKPHIFPVWNYSCRDVVINDVNFSSLSIKYFPHKDEILNIRGEVSQRKEHNLEDLLRGEKNDTH